MRSLTLCFALLSVATCFGQTQQDAEYALDAAESSGTAMEEVYSNCVTLRGEIIDLNESIDDWLDIINTTYGSAARASALASVQNDLDSGAYNRGLGHSAYDVGFGHRDDYSSHILNAWIFYSQGYWASTQVAANDAKDSAENGESFFITAEDYYEIAHAYYTNADQALENWTP